jgi:hypothetical protein
MGLTMSQRRAVTKTAKAVILGELCATRGWHREHARKAQRTALGPQRTATP